MNDEELQQNGDLSESHNVVLQAKQSPSCFPAIPQDSACLCEDAVSWSVVININKDGGQEEEKTKAERGG